MHLFYPQKWGKTCTAVVKTNAYLVAWKLWFKTSNSVNNLSISPHDRFFTWNKARFNKNMSKICNKTLEKAWLVRYSERAFENLHWYLCFKFFQNSCGDISMNLMMISRKAVSQDSERAYSLQLQQKSLLSYGYFQGFTKLLRTIAPWLLLSEVSLKYFET